MEFLIGGVGGFGIGNQLDNLVEQMVEPTKIPFRGSPQVVTRLRTADLQPEHLGLGVNPDLCVVSIGRCR
jgi:hypothetical protein